MKSRPGAWGRGSRPSQTLDLTFRCRFHLLHAFGPFSTLRRSWEPRFGQLSVLILIFHFLVFFPRKVPGKFREISPRVDMITNIRKWRGVVLVIWYPVITLWWGLWFRVVKSLWGCEKWILQKILHRSSDPIFFSDIFFIEKK